MRNGLASKTLCSPWRFSLSRARTNARFDYILLEYICSRLAGIHCVASCMPVSVLRKTHAVGKTIKALEEITLENETL